MMTRKLSFSLLTALTFSVFATGACRSDATEVAADPMTTPVTESSSTGPITQGAPTADLLPIDAITGYVDPVCQMKVAEDAPERHTHEGVTYGFCSPNCRERFAGDPQTYLAALEE